MSTLCGRHGTAENRGAKSPLRSKVHGTSTMGGDSGGFPPCAAAGARCAEPAVACGSPVGSGQRDGIYRKGCNISAAKLQQEATVEFTPCCKPINPSEGSRLSLKAGSHNAKAAASTRSFRERMPTAALAVAGGDRGSGSSSSTAQFSRSSVVRSSAPHVTAPTRSRCTGRSANPWLHPTRSMRSASESPQQSISSRKGPIAGLLGGISTGRPRSGCERTARRG